MEHEITCELLEKMSFKNTVNGHEIIVDADEQFGGENKGPQPKLLLLSSLAGCTGMDVISILRKKRVEVTYFNVRVKGTLTDDHPKYYHSIHLTFEFKGVDLESQRQKLVRAIELSQDKYCGVSASLRPGATLTYDVSILDS